MSKIPTLTLCVLGLVLSGQARAEPDLQDLHLKTLPRSASETAQIAKQTAPTTDFSKSEAFEARQAGATTVDPQLNANAFSQPSANISFDGALEFRVGNALFRQLWVPSPSSEIASDGLGPLYNAQSCEQCHLKDGRGHPPEGLDDTAVSMVIRTEMPGSAALSQIEGYLSAVPDPVYGLQIQDFAVAGHAAEATVQISYTEEKIALSGGETAHLRRPTYSLSDLGYGPLDAATMLSPRVAPQMIGLGLLDAVPAADILSNADPDDQNGDGISGRAQIVMSRAFRKPMLGRFGLKGGQPSLWEQSASAFHGDIGISSTLFPNGYADCTASQTACQNAPDGNSDVHDNAEISDLGMELMTFYASNIAVPARRDLDDPQVLRGKQMFYETGCTSCHTPKFMTHRLAGETEQSSQLIWPYTDMLLHDMGPGLADHFPEARATGQEWRTPPLWGIGLTKTVSGHTYFLHDGRARTLLEAILWHGGEAETQKRQVIDMPPEDRAAIIRFLESL